MRSVGQTGPRYHVLLVGVDDYPGHPLAGCVNDIDEVQRVLVERLGVARDRIERLASPRPGTAYDDSIPAQRATLSNLRDALRRLGSEQVRDGDRVFIYYSGHGKRVALAVAGRTYHREALVPEDFRLASGEDQFLFDFEVNQLLVDIVQRTPSVTVVLDCCHAGSATRDTARLRTFFTHRPVRLHEATRGRRELTPDDLGHGMGQGIDACHVISACLADEYAHEGNYGGKHHGLLTHAFLRALEGIPTAELPTLTWADIWYPMSKLMTRERRDQHPDITGHHLRDVFAGAPVGADRGVPVVYEPDDGRYVVMAGTLADISKDAVLAVYDPRTRSFPPYNSDEDRIARLCELRVERAGFATAFASAIVPAGATTPSLPAGARARLVRGGELPPLRFAVTEGHDEVVIDSPVLQRAGAGEPADVRLELCVDHWRLIDAEHTVDDDAAVLCRIPCGQIARARDVLEHYRTYSMPLRIAGRVAPDDRRNLELTVCCPAANLEARDAQQAIPPEAPGHLGRYELTTGARVCFHVRNTGPVPLQVSLINAAASGRVQLLGEQLIDAESDHLFWYGNQIGAAFEMSPAAGHARGIDRVVAIGRTDRSVSLRHLASERRFADLLAVTRDAGEARRDVGSPGKVRLDWTAAVVVIDTRDEPFRAASSSAVRMTGSRHV